MSHTVDQYAYLVRLYHKYPRLYAGLLKINPELKQLMERLL